MSYTFKQQLISNDSYKLKSPYTMIPEYITIHNTANDASAANEAKYMSSNNNATSFHVAVDDKEVIQLIPFNRNAFHCGDGAKGDGNRKSIGIEICYSKSGGDKYVKAEENAVQYVAKLLKEFNIPITKMVQHNKWSGKDCPHRIRAEKRWDSFVQRVKDVMNGVSELTKEEKTTNKEWFTTSTTESQIQSFITQAVNNAYIERSWLDKFNNKTITVFDIIALQMIVNNKKVNK